MSINIQAKTDYSTLFSSISSSNSSSGSSASDLSSLLTDYATIKSGTYGKLMKAYYSSSTSTDDDDSSDSSSSSALSSLVSATSEETSGYNKVSTSADALAESIDTLSGADEMEEDELYTAVNNYVKNYNSFVRAAGSVSSSSISDRLSTVESTTASYKDELGSYGISIESDGKLSLDKDTFDATDKSGLSKLFSSKSSYGYGISVSAGMAAANANYEATKTSLYDANGNYSSSTGTLLDSMV